MLLQIYWQHNSAIDAQEKGKWYFHTRILSLREGRIVYLVVIASTENPYIKSWNLFVPFFQLLWSGYTFIVVDETEIVITVSDEL